MPTHIPDPEKHGGTLHKERKLWYSPVQFVGQGADISQFYLKRKNEYSFTIVTMQQFLFRLQWVNQLFLHFVLL